MQKTITILLILIIGIAIGFTGGRYYSKSSSQTTTGSKTADSSCEAKLEKVKDMFPTIPETRNISGKIKEIKGKTIILEAINVNPLEDLPTTREITIEDNTKIVKSENKDQTTFQNEMDTYQEKIKAGEKNAIPPMPFAEKEITPADLKVGDQISVEASENIKTKEKFEATKVTLQFMPEIPAAKTPTEIPVSVPNASN